MTTKLILLGILAHANRPMHGYEIKKTIEEWAVGEYARISYGSIYYNLDKMEDEGLVTSKTVKNSKRPERKVYRLTEKGKAEFMRLLRKNYFDIEERVYYPFDVGVVFMPALPKREVIEALEKRIQSVEKMLEMHYKVRDELKRKAPFFVPAIVDHHLLHWEAEKSWLENLKKEVEKRENLLEKNYEKKGVRHEGLR